MRNRNVVLSAAGAEPANYVEDVFSTYLYTSSGISSQNQFIENGINTIDYQSLIWAKSRSNPVDNYLVTRLSTSSTSSRQLISNNSNAGASGDYYTYLTNGYRLPNFPDSATGTASGTNGYTFASWTFRKQKKFFDIVTYTGNATAGRTISHNLGSTPGMIIVKNTSSSGTWIVYHRSLDATKYLWLNETNSAGTSSGYWNNTEPTSSNFTIGNSNGTNESGATFVAYLFAHDAGGFGLSGADSIIKCGTFNGSTGIIDVELGWEPQFVLVKNINAVENWFMWDNMRGMANQGSTAAANDLKPNTADAEATNWVFYPRQTGFSTDLSNSNYVYMAIRRGPMKVPTSGTSVFAPVVYSGNNAARTISAGFVPDVVWFADRSATYWGQDTTIFDRLRGFVYSVSSGSGAETDLSPFVTAFGQSGINITNSGMNNASNIANGYLDYFFGRAPGFMDEVCYTGTGSATTVAHNLGVAPELMIVKSRNNTSSWPVYHPSIGLSYVGLLNSTAAPTALGSINAWNSTAPTDQNISIGTWAGTNSSGWTYVAYLFATCPGVSKVGSYTGTGTTNQINCGFTNGARFVLIKRTDSTGDWYVWDSARGIIAGNDPYLLLNSTAAEVTNTDYIDPYSPGFELSSTAPAALNANGGTYIFLAIA